MACSLSDEQIERTISFHGHTCPGIMIGIRAGELALKEFGEKAAADLVAVVETDMCGVDAIQVLTGCTFGKGNLIHRDYGKMAFNFYDRNTGKGIRALLNHDMRSEQEKKLLEELKTLHHETLGDDELVMSDEFRYRLREFYLQADLDEMFILMEPKLPMPRPAKVMASLKCAGCGEMIMESRARLYGGEILCIPCFKQVEQKIAG